MKFMLIRYKKIVLQMTKCESFVVMRLQPDTAAVK